MKNPPHKIGQICPDWKKRTHLIGILNCTPDSFSDGGLYLEVDKALRHGLHLLEQGADGLDVGAESTRPGAAPVAPEEQLARLGEVLAPLCEGIRAWCQRQKRPFPLLSIDTRSVRVAEFALGLGFHLVNDVSGGRHDPEMLHFVAQTQCLFLPMHSRGTPKNMTQQTRYGPHFFQTLVAEIGEGIEQCLRKGIARENLLLDPGFGFAKTPEQNVEMLRRLQELEVFSLPLWIGVSRKSFLSKMIPEVPADLFSVDALDMSTLVALVLGIQGGANFVRVHRLDGVLPAMRLLDRLCE